MGVPPFASGLLGVAVMAFWLAVFVFWIVVGWRAMRALEGIDDSLRERGPR
jgi:hypothetical protein